MSGVAVGAAVAGAVVAGGIGIAASSMGTDAQGNAINNASGISQNNFAQSQAAINAATQSANGGLAPYSASGQNALNQLNWEMGLVVPGTPGTPATAAKPAVAPTTSQVGQTNDPVWEAILGNFQAAHQARYGQTFNRGWNADADAANQYAALQAEYQKQVAGTPATAATPDTPFVGQGQQGALLQPIDAFKPIATNQNYTMDQYKNDPLYTPMVNSLAELQATPGYQFQLDQGLQSVNNSASARGSLLSGAALKEINNYAQGTAATGYQAAWQRAQQAYQQAFGNNQNLQSTVFNQNSANQANQFNQANTNQNNAFNRLLALTNNGQNSATQQGTNTMNGATALVGAANTNANNQMGAAMAQGQNQANMYTGIGNGLNTGIATGINAYQNSGNNNTGSAGTLNGMVTGNVNNQIANGVNF